LTIVSPGTQKRNFTFIDDIINGLILVGMHGKGDDHCIGSTESYSIIDIAEMFGGEIQMLPGRKGNRLENFINLEKMSELG
jgi:UDP-glucose 4-epimerase